MKHTNTTLIPNLLAAKTHLFASSVNPDHTTPRNSLIKVITVCNLSFFPVEIHANATWICLQLNSNNFFPKMSRLSVKEKCYVVLIPSIILTVQIYGHYPTKHILQAHLNYDPNNRKLCYMWGLKSTCILTGKRKYALQSWPVVALADCFKPATSCFVWTASNIAMSLFLTATKSPAMMYQNVLKYWDT